METLRGYSIKGRKGLSHWDGLMEEWLLAVERYCRIMKGEDAPYFYNERANISVLSGAAWRSGRIALEEFQSDKGYSNQKKKYGRVDLWLGDAHREELVEAKFRWICMGSENAYDMVDESMQSAVADAKKSCAGTGASAVGVGFFPVYKSSNRVDDIDELITLTIDEFLTFDYHAIAWCFPKETREFHSSTGNVIPGIIMLAKNIDY